MAVVWPRVRRWPIFRPVRVDSIVAPVVRRTVCVFVAQRWGPAALREFSGPRRGRLIRPAMVHGSEQIPIGRRCMLMLDLLAGHRDAMLAGSINFNRSWTSVCATRAAVEAHAIESGVLNDGRVVRVVDYVDVHVVDVAVVKVAVVAPVAAVKADDRSPVNRIPDVGIILPSPVS